MLQKAIKASLIAGQEILNVYNSSDFGVETKEDNSPLTRADKAAHDAIVAQLEDTGLPIFSEEGGKIPFEERKDWGPYWLVDPLDGTKEFIKRNGDFTVNIALIESGKPIMGIVYVPVTDTLYFAEEGKGAWLREKAGEGDRGQDKKLEAHAPKDKKISIVASRSHLNEDTAAFIKRMEDKGYIVETTSRGSSLKLCQVAEGKAQLYPRLGPTMEWDTAAAHGVCREAGAAVIDFETKEEMKYNRENLLNNYFLVYPKDWNENFYE
ncbi:MAG: 3'(2'),5'-bisphosphate nucleotidase CysQ [Spirochaetales bacterium]|nr:3'(2'),5'-bisphosphate nucleotidase CysQ [Spirochaetales bacterium]